MIDEKVLAHKLHILRLWSPFVEYVASLKSFCTVNPGTGEVIENLTSDGSDNNLYAVYLERWKNGDYVKNNEGIKYQGTDFIPEYVLKNRTRMRRRKAQKVNPLLLDSGGTGGDFYEVKSPGSTWELRLKLRG